MKADTLLDAIGMISDEYVQDAKSVRVVKKSHPWLKWSTMAACACFLIYLGLQSGFVGGFGEECATNDAGNSMNSGSTQNTGSNSNAGGSTDTNNHESASDGGQESFEENQSSYPYNDKLVLDYVGMELEDMETAMGTIIFHEITDIDMYRELNYHVAGAYMYETRDSLYRYVVEAGDTDYFQLIEEKVWSGEDTYETACAIQEDIAVIKDYLLAEESLGNTVYGAVSESAETVVLQTALAEGPNGQVTVLASKDLDALGDEVQAFVTPMREILGTESSSIVSGQEAAVQYFYQQRMFREEAVEECYHFYGYFERDAVQYLYQFTSNWTLPGEAVTVIHNPPHTISEALSQEESREVFAEILAGIVECLE